MYIEFQLPKSAPSHAWGTIGIKLHDWAAKYNIKYRQKIHKYHLRVTFDSDEYYTLFALTWVAPEWTTYRLVTDLNNKI